MATNNPSTHTDAGAPQAWTPEDIQFRVLLAIPDVRTIPIFALGVEAQRPALDTQVTSSQEALSRLVGVNLSRSLQSRYGEHRPIDVRRRVDQRTAVYSHWLAFHEIAQAEAFVRDHPRFGLDHIEWKAKADLASGRDLLGRQLSKGRFDLSRYELLVRVSRAQEYVQRPGAVLIRTFGAANWDNLRLLTSRKLNA